MILTYIRSACLLLLQRRNQVLVSHYFTSLPLSVLRFLLSFPLFDSCLLSRVSLKPDSDVDDDRYESEKVIESMKFCWIEGKRRVHITWTEWEEEQEEKGRYEKQNRMKEATSRERKREKIVECHAFYECILWIPDSAGFCGNAFLPILTNCLFLFSLLCPPASTLVSGIWDVDASLLFTFCSRSFSLLNCISD